MSGFGFYQSKKLFLSFDYKSVTFFEHFPRCFIILSQTSLLIWQTQSIIICKKYRQTAVVYIKHKHHKFRISDPNVMFKGPGFLLAIASKKYSTQMIWTFTMSLLFHGNSIHISFYISTKGFLVYLILQAQSIIILPKQAQQKKFAHSFNEKRSFSKEKLV